MLTFVCVFVEPLHTGEKRDAVGISLVISTNFGDVLGEIDELY